METLTFPPIEGIEDAQSAPVEIAAEVIDFAEIKAGNVLVKYNRTEAALRDLRSRFAGAKFDLTTTKGDKAARAARLEFVTLRTSLEKMRKELKTPALEFGKKIDAEAQRITAEIKALEDPIDAQIKADETRRENERLEAARIEADRKAKHEASIARIRGFVDQAKGLSSERIAKGRAAASLITIGDDFQEFKGQAITALNETLAALQSMHDEAKAREDEAARLEAQRIENERIAAEQAEQKRKLDEQALEIAERLRKLAEQEAEIARKSEPVAQPVEVVQEVVAVAEPVELAVESASEVVAQTVTPPPTEPTAIDTAPMGRFVSKIMTTGQICERLGITVSAGFLIELGINSVQQNGPGTYFYESTFNAICDAISAHVLACKEAA